MAFVAGQGKTKKTAGIDTSGLKAESYYSSALARSQGRYESMLSELRKAVTEVGQLPPEFQQVIDIYKTGGEYGVGAKTAIEKAARYGTSQSMANLVRTGMSSGTIAQGVRARYGRQATEQKQGVEDIRYEKLSSALQALGAAKKSRGLETAGVYQTMAQLIAGYREPTLGEYSNPEAIAALQAQLGLKELGSRESIARTEQAGATERLQAQLKSQEEQTKALTTQQRYI